jgi:hypothetical protein
MKIKLLLFFFLAALAGCATISKKADFANEMDGFRQYKWGTSVEEIDDALIPQGFDKGRNVEWFARRKDDPAAIGKARPESINYVFRNGRLVAVSIIARGPSNYRALREELEQRLGKIEPADKNAYSWDLAQTMILFSYSEQTETAMLVIRAKGY